MAHSFLLSVDPPNLEFSNPAPSVPIPMVDMVESVALAHPSVLNSDASDDEGLPSSAFPGPLAESQI